MAILLKVGFGSTNAPVIMQRALRTAEVAVGVPAIAVLKFLRFVGPNLHQNT